MFPAPPAHIKYGPLQVLEERPASVNTTGNTTEPQTVVIFHGYGANARDLWPLHSALQAPNIDRWLFPEAPLELRELPEGRCWYPIDLDALERALARGHARDFSGPLPEDLLSSEHLVLEMFQSAGICPAQTFIGGFSQGAILATDLFLRSSLPFAGLLIFSGAYLGRQEWPERVAARPGAVFQSHGHSDPLLPFDGAQELHQLFTNHAWDGSFHPFSGGHEIPPEVLQEAQKFLVQHSSPADETSQPI